MMSLFINGSPNRNGHTSQLAHLIDPDLTQLDLIDYSINVYGQEKDGDQFEEIIEEIKKYDTIILGSPVYWHNICGSVRNLLDRFYGPIPSAYFKGKKLYFVYQGGAPEKWMMEVGEYTIKRFCQLYGFDYQGMVSNKKDIK